jgi:hypothetical protein
MNTQEKATKKEETRQILGETLVGSIPKEQQALKLAEGFRFVTVPKEDVYGTPFRGLDNNNDHFGPGTHLVPSGLADALEDRLKAWAGAMVRLLRPNPDGRAQRMADQGIPLANAEAHPDLR